MLQVGEQLARHPRRVADVAAGLRIPLAEAEVQLHLHHVPGLVPLYIRREIDPSSAEIAELE